jgi:hypothetical protein
MNSYLKRGDGEVYGPVDLPTLQLWATDGRVAPDDKISTDQKKWTPASDLAELAMDWKVELRDSSVYGPIHLLALRDLIRDGTVSSQAKIKHKKSGEVKVACEALLAELTRAESSAPEAISALAARLEEAETRIEQLQKDLQRASGVENKLRDEVKNLTAKQKIIVPPPSAPPAEIQDLREQVEKWKKLYKDEQSAAATREAELKHQIRGQKSSEDDHNTLVQEVEKWKKMHARAAAEIEQMKSRPAGDQPGGGEMVPRTRFEDLERKLSQTERSYQQLLKTLNRSLGARARGQPSPRADNLQRRDVS